MALVFPNADVKVFLTADPSARALRRAVQRAVETPPGCQCRQSLLVERILTQGPQPPATKRLCEKIPHLKPAPDAPSTRPR